MAATVDGELLLWGRRSKSAAGSDDCLSPTVNSDVMVAAADTSRHLDICSPTQLRVDSGSAKGHSRQPSNTSISSVTGADDASASKNTGMISEFYLKCAVTVKRFSCLLDQLFSVYNNSNCNSQYHF